jgi:hypothetical protein
LGVAVLAGDPEQPATQLQATGIRACVAVLGEQLLACHRVIKGYVRQESVRDAMRICHRANEAGMEQCHRGNGHSPPQHLQDDNRKMSDNEEAYDVCLNQAMERGRVCVTIKNSSACVDQAKSEAEECSRSFLQQQESIFGSRDALVRDGGIPSQMPAKQLRKAPTGGKL